ncbi:hypothetical protein GCM10011428_39420 [Streptomyces violaceus]
MPLSDGEGGAELAAGVQVAGDQRGDLPADVRPGKADDELVQSRRAEAKFGVASVEASGEVGVGEG